MIVIAYEPSGFEGRLVTIEVDIRRGIPGVDLVGLAAGAVRESRDRVRAAVRNSGFAFPSDRILINLAPADLPKAGSSYDLPIALSVLGAAGAIPDPGFPFLALGELTLGGSVRPVRGVLPAVTAATAAGIGSCIVPSANASEARAAKGCGVYPIDRLDDATALLLRIRAGDLPVAPHKTISPRESGLQEGDLAELRGQGRLRRVLEIAAAGGHNLLLCGPPGSGKTMAARRFIGLLPDLGEKEAIEVAAIHSLCGLLGEDSALNMRPPFRSPHHSASLEGMVGGGRQIRPGEISLAHRGVLFLDEASEFRMDVLQALREPIEEGRISLVRAGSVARFPANFQVLLAANPCPCGSLGKPGRPCLCSILELQRHRKKIGGPLLDRIDLRVPVSPISARDLVGPPGEGSSSVRPRVEAAAAIQENRYRASGISRNARLRPDQVEAHCALHGPAIAAFERAVDKLSLSSRACHSILKVSRTIADLEGGGPIDAKHILEAVQHRRFLDGDEVWI
jgi:magnesium chelatase family protein